MGGSTMTLIRNKTTGETREVPDTELTNYGISSSPTPVKQPSVLDGVLGKARQFGQEKIQPAINKPIELSGPVATAYNAATQVEDIPAVRETVGAFGKGYLSGETGQSDFIPSPETTPGKFIEGAGYVTGMFNPHSLINKAIGKGMKVVGEGSRFLATKTPIIKDIVEAGGRKLSSFKQEIGQRLASETLRPSPTQVARTIDAAGESTLLKDAAGKGLEKMTPKEILVESSKKKAEIWPQVESFIAKNADKLPRIDTYSIIESLDKEYKLLSLAGGPASMAKAQTLKEIQDNLLKQFGETMSWEDLFKQKTIWNQLAEGTYKTGKDAAVSEIGQAEQLAYRILADTSREVANELADKAAKETGERAFSQMVRDYGLWENLESYAKSSRGRQLSGGLGIRGLLTGLPGRIIASPYTISTVGKTIDAGKKLIPGTIPPLLKGLITSSQE